MYPSSLKFRLWQRLPLVGIGIAGFAFGLSSPTSAREQFVILDSAFNLEIRSSSLFPTSTGLNAEIVKYASRIPAISKIDPTVSQSLFPAKSILTPYTISFSTLQNNYRQLTSGLWYLTKNLLPLAAKNYQDLINDADNQAYFANQRLDALKTYQQQKSLTFNSQREQLLQGILLRTLTNENVFGSTPYFNAFNDVLTTIYKARKELAAGAKGVPLTQQEQDALANSLDFEKANQDLLAGLGVRTSSSSTSLPPNQVADNLATLGIDSYLLSRYLQASPKAELISTAYAAATEHAATQDQVPTSAQAKSTLIFINSSELLARELGQHYGRLIKRINLDNETSPEAKNLLFKQIAETKQLHDDFVAAKDAYSATLDRVLGPYFTNFDIVQSYRGGSIETLKEKLGNWSDYFAILTPNRKEYATKTQLFLAYRDHRSSERPSYDQTRLYLESEWVKKQLTSTNFSTLVSPTTYQPTNNSNSVLTRETIRPPFVMAQDAVRNHPTNYWPLLNGNLHRQLVRFDTEQFLGDIGFTSYKEPFHSDAWINHTRFIDAHMLQRGIDASGYSVNVPPQSGALTRWVDFANSPERRYLPHLRKLRPQVWSIGNYRWNALAAVKIPSLTLSHNQVGTSKKFTYNQQPRSEITETNYDRHPYQDDVLAIAEIGNSGSTASVLRDLDLVASEGFTGTFGISYTDELITADNQVGLDQFDWSGIHSGKVQPFAYSKTNNQSLTYMLLRGIARNNQFVFDTRNQNSLTNDPALSKYVTFVASISNKDLAQTCQDVLSNCLLVAEDVDPVSRYLEAAALVLQQFNFFTPEQVRYTLLSTATPVDSDPTSKDYNPRQAKNLGLLNVSESLLGPRWLPTNTLLDYTRRSGYKIAPHVIAFHNPIQNDFLRGLAGKNQTVVFTGQNLYLETYFQNLGQLVITAPENTIGTSNTIPQTVFTDFNPELHKMSYSSDEEGKEESSPVSQANKFAEFLGAGTRKALMNSVVTRGARVAVRDAYVGSISTNSFFEQIQSATELAYADDGRATTQADVYTDEHGWQQYSYGYVKGKYVKRNNSLVNLENVHFFSDYLPDENTTTVYQVDSQGKQTVYFDEAQDKFLGYAVINFADGLKSNLTKARLWAQVATKPTVAQPQSQFKGIWLYGAAKHLYAVGQKVKFAYAEDLSEVTAPEVAKDKDNFSGFSDKAKPKYLEYAYVNLTPRSSRAVATSIASGLDQDADTTSLEASPLLAALALDPAVPSSSQTKAAQMANQLENLPTLVSQEQLTKLGFEPANTSNLAAHTDQATNLNSTQSQTAARVSPKATLTGSAEASRTNDNLHSEDSDKFFKDQTETTNARSENQLLGSEKSDQAYANQFFAPEMHRLTLSQRQALLDRARTNASLLYRDVLQVSAESANSAEDSSEADKNTAAKNTNDNPELTALNSSGFSAHPNLIQAAAKLQASMAKASDQELAQLLYRTSGSLYANSQVASSSVQKQQAVSFFQELPFASSANALTSFLRAPAKPKVSAQVSEKTANSATATVATTTPANSSAVSSRQTSDFSGTTYASYDYQLAKWTQAKSGLVGQSSQHTASVGVYGTKPLALSNSTADAVGAALGARFGLNSLVAGVAVSATTGAWTEDYSANSQAGANGSAAAASAQTRVSDVSYKQVGVNAALGLGNDQLAFALTSGFSYQGAQVNRTIASAADLQADTNVYQGLVGLQAQAKLGTSLRGVKLTGGLAYVLRHTSAFAEKVSAQAAQDPTNLAQLFALKAQASTAGAPLANLGVHAYWSFGNSGLARQLQVKAAVSYDFSQASAYSIQASTKPSELGATSASSSAGSSSVNSSAANSVHAANTKKAIFSTGSSFAPGWQGQVKLGYRHDLTPSWSLSAEAGVSFTSYWLAKQASVTLSYRF